MNQETEIMLNRFLQFLFNGNAVIDNICYNLKHDGYACIEAAIHEPMAHKMGAWADDVSDLMDKLDGRPVRYALPENTERLKAVEGLERLVSYFDELRSVTIKAISSAEDNGEYEVKIFLEEFLENKVTTYRRQAIQWRDAAKAIGADSLNVHIAEYTSYIS